jgi:hypothetical protein
VSVPGSNWNVVTGVIVVVLTGAHVANEPPIVPELASELLKFQNNFGLVPENRVVLVLLELNETSRSTLPVLFKISGVPPTVVFSVPPVALSVEL